jgi:hypothetical protein
MSRIAIAAALSAAILPAAAPAAPLLKSPSSYNRTYVLDCKLAGGATQNGAVSLPRGLIAITNTTGRTIPKGTVVTIFLRNLAENPNNAYTKWYIQRYADRDIPAGGQWTIRTTMIPATGLGTRCIAGVTMSLVAR